MAALEADMFIEINQKFYNTNLIFLWIKDHSVSSRFFLCKQFVFPENTNLTEVKNFIIILNTKTQLKG
jgi:hypothetical protein